MDSKTVDDIKSFMNTYWLMSFLLERKRCILTTGICVQDRPPTFLSFGGSMMFT